MASGAVRQIGNVSRSEFEERLEAQRLHVRRVVDEAKRASAEAISALTSYEALLHQLKLDIVGLDSIRTADSYKHTSDAHDRITRLEALIESRTLRGRWRRFWAWCSARTRRLKDWLQGEKPVRRPKQEGV